MKPKFDAKRPLEHSAYVLPKHRIIICTVLKAGMSSITEAVLTAYGRTRDDRDVNRKSRFWIAPQTTWRFRLPAFGVVRAPVDRFVSGYAWRQTVDADPYNAGWHDAKTVDDYLDICAMSSAGRKRNGIADDPHFMPQTPMLRPVAHPWRFDRLREWWRHVQAIAARPLPDLPHCNPSTEKPVLTAAQIERVRTIYRDEVALYERAR